MARKKTTKSSAPNSNLFDNLEPFDPKSQANANSANLDNQTVSTPVSPLGPPRRIQPTDAAPTGEGAANARIAQLQAELKEARHAQQQLERRNFELETAVSR
ncbi:MAG: hypothetical protein KC421_25995, partial [Anaerolineales bacterium]|nr:hypothetical protein [Anaerolineales bacterium]